MDLRKCNHITGIHKWIQDIKDSKNIYFPGDAAERVWGKEVEKGDREGRGEVGVQEDVGSALLTILGVLTLPLILLLPISATFVALDLISNLWNTISPALKLIFSS